MSSGRKPRQPEPVALAKLIEELAADGRSLIGIARGIGVSMVVLRRWLDQRTELSEALQAGHERERHELHGVLKKIALDVNEDARDRISAATFLLARRHGYVDRSVSKPGDTRAVAASEIRAAISAMEHATAAIGTPTHH